jgi:chemotaxis protein methyltransferase CheR
MSKALGNRAEAGGDLKAVVLPDWQAPLSDAQFDFLRSAVKTHTGISLADYKRNMLYRRISSRMRALGLADVDAYCDVLKGIDAALEVPLFINAVTTNKTSFFREAHHFEHLAKVALPDIEARAARSGRRRLRIWSAGCSSGEEPYTIAITLCEHLQAMMHWDAKILATDIDTNMVDSAREGFYDRELTRPIPAELHGKYLRPSADGGERFRMAENLRSLITFKPLNLLGEWPMKGPFDAIFCRNVVIYFDKTTQRVLFDRFADLLALDGLLYIGHSESLFGVSERFQAIGQSVYRRVA